MPSYISNNIGACFTAGAAFLYAGYSALQNHNLAVQAASSAMDAARNAWIWNRDTLTANAAAEYAGSLASYSPDWIGVAALTATALLARPIINRIGSYFTQDPRMVAIQPVVRVEAPLSSTPVSEAEEEIVQESFEVPHLVCGTISQYTIGANSACGPIAALAAQELLKTSTFTSEEIDKLVRDGKEFYEEVCESMRTELGVSRETFPIDCLSADCYLAPSRGLQIDVERQGMDLPEGREVLLIAGEEQAKYQSLLQPFMIGAQSTNRSAVGILTLTPETYAIKFDPTANHWLLFNSHGNDFSITPTPTACLIKFASLEDLTDYLAKKKCAAPPDAQNQDINRCVLYRVFEKS